MASSRVVGALASISSPCLLKSRREREREFISQINGGLLDKAFAHRAGQNDDRLPQHVRCEWVNVCSGTGSLGKSRTKGRKMAVRVLLVMGWAPGMKSAICNCLVVGVIQGVSPSQWYIAAQGPMPETVVDFWKMLWDNDVKIVVMACNEYEGSPKKVCCFCEISLKIVPVATFCESDKFRHPEMQ